MDTHKLPPYTRVPMSVFRKLVKKPYTRVDAFIDYKADFDTDKLQSINFYYSKWGWKCRSTVQRKMKEFNNDIKTFNKECNDHNKVVKSKKRDDTLNRTANGTPKEPNQCYKWSLDGTPNGTPYNTHKKEPLSTHSFEKTSRESEKKSKAIPDGAIYNRANEILGHPTTNAGKDFEGVKTDQVIKIEGRLRRRLIFHSGHEHIFILRKVDANKIYEIFHAYQDQSTNKKLTKVKELLPSTFESF